MKPRLQESKTVGFRTFSRATMRFDPVQLRGRTVTNDAVEQKLCRFENTKTSNSNRTEFNKADHLQKLPAKATVLLCQDKYRYTKFRKRIL